MDNDENKQHPNKLENVGVSDKKKWVAYAGAGAFMFFLIKGLLWLIIPAVLIWWGAR